MQESNADQRHSSSPIHRVERVFAQRMRDLRQAQGLSQAKFANALSSNGLKLDPSAITRIEKNADEPDGARTILLGEAVLIAKTLGVRLPEMLRETMSPAEQFIRAAEHLVQIQTRRQALLGRLREVEDEAAAAVNLVARNKALLDESDTEDPGMKLLLELAEREIRQPWERKRAILLNLLKKNGATPDELVEADADLVNQGDAKARRRTRKRLEKAGIDLEDYTTFDWDALERA